MNRIKQCYLYRLIMRFIVFYKDKNGIPRVITHPHNLFEWVYEQLTLTDITKAVE